MILDTSPLCNCPESFQLIPLKHRSRLKPTIESPVITTIILNTSEDESSDVEDEPSEPVFSSDNLLLSSASEFYNCEFITKKEVNLAPRRHDSKSADNCIEFTKEFMNLDSNLCLIPPDETRSAASRVKSPTHSIVIPAQQIPPFNTCQTTIVDAQNMVKNFTTALSWGTTVPSDIYLPFSCGQQNYSINNAFDQRVEQVTIPPINTQQNNCVSKRWWYGAMLHDHQSFLNSKDDRGASCQVRSPEEDKETFDESSFIVATYNFNECDNKEKQKSCRNFI